MNKTQKTSKEREPKRKDVYMAIALGTIAGVTVWLYVSLLNYLYP